MRVDEHAQHAKRFIVLDETHAAHISSEVVNKIDIRHGAFAVLFILKIDLQIFRFGEHLKPFLERLHINRANFFSLAKQIGHQMTTDEAAAATNYDFFRFHFSSRSNEAATLTGKRAASTRSKITDLLDARRRTKQPIAHEIVNEQGIVTQISRSEPARLGDHSMQPGQPESLHPTWGEFTPPAEQRERVAHRQENPAIVTRLIVDDPSFHPPAVQRHPDKIRTRAVDRFRKLRFVRFSPRAKWWT